MNDTYDSPYFDKLLDCRATTHILNNNSKFINFDKDLDFSRYIVEPVDYSEYNLALKSGGMMGDACVKMTDTNTWCIQ